MNQILKGKQWKARKIENNYIINLDHQSDLAEALTDFILTQNIKEGQFSGVGFLDEIVLNCFDPVTDKHMDRELSGLVLVIDLQGNASVIDEKLSLNFKINFKLNENLFSDNQLITGKIHEKMDLIFYSLDNQKINFMNKISNLDFIDFNYN